MSNHNFSAILLNLNFISKKCLVQNKFILVNKMLHHGTLFQCGTIILATKLKNEQITFKEKRTEGNILYSICLLSNTVQVVKINSIQWQRREQDLILSTASHEWKCVDGFSCSFVLVCHCLVHVNYNLIRFHHSSWWWLREWWCLHVDHVTGQSFVMYDKMCSYTGMLSFLADSDRILWVSVFSGVIWRD